jgi:hypothetical protein
MRACILKVYSAMLLFDDIDLTLCLETEPSVLADISQPAGLSASTVEDEGMLTRRSPVYRFLRPRSLSGRHQQI